MQRALLIASIAAIALGSINFLWVVAEGTGAPSLHRASLAITHPSAMLGLFYLLFRFGFPTFMGTRTVDATALVQEVVASGPRVAFVRCGGLIGDVRLTAPLLAVTVHPAGILLKPMAMPQLALHRESIRSTRTVDGFLSKRFQIVHSSGDMPSPVVLYLRGDHAVAQAITRLAASGEGTTRESTARPADPLRRPLTRVTAISNLIVGLGLLTITLTSFTPVSVFSVVSLAVAVIFVASGVWGLRRS